MMLKSNLSQRGLLIILYTLIVMVCSSRVYGQCAPENGFTYDPVTNSSWQSTVNGNGPFIAIITRRILRSGTEYIFPDYGTGSPNGQQLYDGIRIFEPDRYRENFADDVNISTVYGTAGNEWLFSYRSKLESSFRQRFRCATGQPINDPYTPSVFNNGYQVRVRSNDGQLSYTQLASSNNSPTGYVMHNVVQANTASAFIAAVNETLECNTLSRSFTSVEPGGECDDFPIGVYTDQYTAVVQAIFNGDGCSYIFDFDNNGQDNGYSANCDDAYPPVNGNPDCSENCIRYRTDQGNTWKTVCINGNGGESAVPRVIRYTDGNNGNNTYQLRILRRSDNLREYESPILTRFPEVQIGTRGIRYAQGTQVTCGWQAIPAHTFDAGTWTLTDKAGCTYVPSTSSSKGKIKCETCTPNQKISLALLSASTGGAIGAGFGAAGGIFATFSGQILGGATAGGLGYYIGSAANAICPSNEFNALEQAVSNSEEYLLRSDTQDRQAIREPIFTENAIDANIFPNPARETLTVQYRCSENTHTISIQIVDLNGQVQKEIQSLPTAGDISTESISLSSLLNGFYFVRLIDNLGNIYTQKLVVSGR